MLQSKQYVFLKGGVIMKKDDCIFCKLANGDIPVEAVYEDDVVKAIFDASPASEGHILILPKDHADNIYDLTDEQASGVFRAAKKIACAMREGLDYDGMNVVQNNGEIAGQTVFHFHMHLIPRYKGDSVNVGWKPGKITEEKIAELKGKIAGCL